MRKVVIVYEGSFGSVKTELVVAGEVIKETKLQIVVKSGIGTLHFINKSNIKQIVELEEEK